MIGISSAQLIANVTESLVIEQYNGQLCVLPEKDICVKGSFPLTIKTGDDLDRGFFIRACGPLPLIEVTSFTLSKKKAALTPHDFVEDKTDKKCRVFSIRGYKEMVVWAGRETGKGVL